MSIFGSFWKKDSGNTRKAPASGRWQVGDKIANRYEIHQILGGEGKSGMGIVYVCYDHNGENVVALKTFQDKYLFSENSQKLFEREALIWTYLERHPFIVHAFSVNRLEGRLFIFLEYIPPDRQGCNTLAHYLGNLSLSEILKFSIQFCYGMEYAYSKGIDCHRDIKPDNIMITPDKNVKITDFGLVKAFQEIGIGKDIISSSARTGLSIFQTKEGKGACGTLQYMSPEQFDGYADKRSDVYSFGVTLYQMVAGGRFPFVAKGRTEEEVQKDYERLHKHENVPMISSPLYTIIQKCLEKVSDKRYQDFTLIREELQNLLLKETGERIAPPETEESGTLDWDNRGTALYNLGRYNEAIRCHEKAIELAPADAYCWTNKGNALFQLNKHRDALSCYDKAIDIDPSFAEAWNNKGNVLIILNRHLEALNCFDKAIEFNPRYADGWYSKGLVLNALGKTQNSICCFDKAIELNPRHAVIWYKKGLALSNLNRIEDAILCFDKAIELNPGDVTMLYTKIGALASLSRLDEVLKCLEEAEKLDPNFSKVSPELKSSILKLKQLPETKKSESWEWNEKGNSLCALGRFDEAIICYDKALKIDPRGCGGETIHNKGIALSKVGKRQEAIDCIDKAIEIAPGEDEYLVSKGAILASLGRFNEALECVEEAIKTNPDPSIYKLKQEILRASDCIGKKQEAVVYYDMATGESGEHLAWYKKGFGFTTFFRPKKALICFDKAIEINPKYAKAWVAKGNVLMLLNRDDEALKCIEEALKLDPHLSYAHELKKILQE